MRKTLLGCLLAAAAALPFCPAAAGRLTVDLNTDWRYFPGEWPQAERPETDDGAWLYVNVPHSTVQYTPEHYYHVDLGVYWYRRTFVPDPALKGRQLTLTFEGAMQEARVWLNGEPLGTHCGGYTEFAFDVTGKVRFGAENVLAVRLDTRPNTAFAPGKTRPDFQYFGGLYRDVRLTATEPVHVTDPILSQTANGGGVLLTAPKVSAEEAVVRAKTEVCNASAGESAVTLRTELLEADGRTVAASAETEVTLPAGEKLSVTQDLTVTAPRLWSPDAPELYTVRTAVLQGGTVLDALDTVYGIRKVEWVRGRGCLINGEPVELVGVNLHSEAYMRGNALDDAAIDAEIRRLRSYGFNFIRMSHYPHDKAFYEACDRYGVAVIDCLAGWQYYNGSQAFLESCKAQMREQIRVNRNHPCVIAWEPSLNESGFTRAWAQTMHDLVQEELPRDGDFRAYTGGWICWDVFDLGVGTPQADVVTDAEVRHPDRAVIVSEYGDWNFGGFNSTSRVTREPSRYPSAKGGDEGMLEQCDNIQSSFAFNRSKAWCAASAYWDYADYAGFDTEKLTFCGVVDVARLPKFGAYFYRSQTDPDADLSAYGLESGPMVFIANSWLKDSPETVRVFTNCDAVELWLDGTLLERRETPDATMWAPHGNTSNPTDHPRPGQGAYVSTEHLAHPPFTFDLRGRAVPGTGTLTAKAYRKGASEPAAVFVRRAPEAPARLTLTPEDDRPLRLDGSSAKLVWVDVRDAHGTVDVTSSAPVTFAVEGPGLVIGEKTLPVRGGRWAVWVRSRRGSGPVVLRAESDGLLAAELTLETQAAVGLPPCPQGGDADEAGFVHPEPPAPPVNILLNRPASASSVNAPSGRASEAAALANDGAEPTKWCAARPAGVTDRLGEHWWQADLGSVHTVTSVTAVFEKAAPWVFAVAVSDDPSFAGVDPNALRQTAEGDRVTVAPDARGRYLRIWLNVPAADQWPCLREVSAAGRSDNLAFGAPVSASAASASAKLAVDSNPATFWCAGRNGPAAFTADLGQVYGLTGAEVSFAWPAADDGVPVRHGFALEGSADGQTWYPLGCWSDLNAAAGTPAAPTASLSFAAVARWLRVSGLTAVRSDTAAPQWAEIAEFAAYGYEPGSSVRMDYNAPTEATSCAPGVTPDFGNDGNPAQYWMPAADDDDPAWTFDAGKVRVIHSVELTWDHAGPHRYALEISEDKVSWTRVADFLGTASAPAGTTRDLCCGRARYVRVRVPAGTQEGFWVNVTGYAVERE